MNRFSATVEIVAPASASGDLGDLPIAVELSLQYERNIEARCAVVMCLKEYEISCADR